jgi:hypothetical protein
VHQHRLCLVIAVVANRDLDRSDLPGDVGQEGIADPPRGFLKGKFVVLGEGWHIPPDNRGRQTPLSSQVSHESRVGVRLLAARPVVEMSHMKPKSVVCLQPRQEMEQTKGIRATGDTDDHSVTDSQQVVTLDEITNLNQKIHWVDYTTL